MQWLLNLSLFGVAAPASMANAGVNDIQLSAVIFLKNKFGKKNYKTAFEAGFAEG